jgi:uncharacterized protein
MQGTTELTAAIRSGDAVRVRELLDDRPDLARHLVDGGISPLLLALYHGQTEVLAEVRGHVTMLDLFEAAALGDTSRIEVILEDDPARANEEAGDGFTPLTLAAFFGRYEVLNRLLVLGADPNRPAANATRVHPLHSAAAHRDPEIAFAMTSALLEAGANPNVAQQGDWTPLHQAAAHGLRPLVDLLVAHGADIAARSDDGRTPADMAAEKGYGDLAGLLSVGPAP